MKKTVSLAIAFVFSAFTLLMAQGGPQQMDPAERAKTTVERLKPELSLTEQQEKDITPVYTAYFESFQKMMQSGERPTPEARQKMTTERNEKLKKYLSEEQMKKLAEYEEKMMQQRRQGGGGGGNRQ